MDLIDLITPVVAVVALFAAIFLALLQFRQGRYLRQLEERTANGGGGAPPGAGESASLARIAQLQARPIVSSGVRALSGPRRAVGLAGSGVVLAAVLGAGVWYFAVRDSGTPKAQTGRVDRRPRPPVGDGSIAATLKPLPASKSAYTVAVFNGSGVTGAANAELSRVGQLGYSTGVTGNTASVKRSVVMFTPGNRLVGEHVGKDLGIRTARLLDGLRKSQIGAADAVVVLGSDMAGRVVGGTSTGP